MVPTRDNELLGSGEGVMFSESCLQVSVTLIASLGCSNDRVFISIWLVVTLLVTRLSLPQDLSNVLRSKILRDGRGLGSPLPNEMPGDSSSA